LSSWLSGVEAFAVETSEIGTPEPRSAPTHRRGGTQAPRPASAPAEGAAAWLGAAAPPVFRERRVAGVLAMEASSAKRAPVGLQAPAGRALLERAARARAAVRGLVAVRALREREERRVAEAVEE
jgi:hypothetical protein